MTGAAGFLLKLKEERLGTTIVDHKQRIAGRKIVEAAKDQPAPLGARLSRASGVVIISCGRANADLEDVGEIQLHNTTAARLKQYQPHIF